MNLAHLLFYCDVPEIMSMNYFSSLLALVSTSLLEPAVWTSAVASMASFTGEKFSCSLG